MVAGWGYLTVLMEPPHQPRLGKILLRAGFNLFSCRRPVPFLKQVAVVAGTSLQVPQRTHPGRCPIHRFDALAGIQAQHTTVDVE
jgi:hypothetical protein